MGDLRGELKVLGFKINMAPGMRQYIRISYEKKLWQKKKGLNGIFWEISGGFRGISVKGRSHNKNEEKGERDLKESPVKGGVSTPFRCK